MLRWFQEQEHCESSDLMNDNTLQGYHILSSQTVWTIEVRTNLTKKIEVKIEKQEFYIYVGVFLVQVVGDGHTKGFLTPSHAHYAPISHFDFDFAALKDMVTIIWHFPRHRTKDVKASTRRNYYFWSLQHLNSPLCEFVHLSRIRAISTDTITFLYAWK